MPDKSWKIDSNSSGTFFIHGCIQVYTVLYPQQVIACIDTPDYPLIVVVDVR